MMVINIQLPSEQSVLFINTQIPLLSGTCCDPGWGGGVRGGIAVYMWEGSPGRSTGVGHTARETWQAGGLQLETPQGWGLVPSARIPEIEWR